MAGFKPSFSIVSDQVKNFGLSRFDKYTVTNTYNPDEKIATSYLGTPIYSNLWIKEGQFTDPVNGQTVKYPEIIVDSVLFEVSGDKNVVVTEIQGRDGSIKEYISAKDYSISVAGNLVSNSVNQVPQDQKNALIAIAKAKTSVEIVSSFLNDFGIYNVVIMNHSIVEKQGSRNVIPFTLQCVSDMPYDLEIEQEGN